MYIYLLILNIVFGQVEFENPISKGKLTHSKLKEISGLERSSLHDIIWSHNDSGGKGIIYGLNDSGKIICNLILKDINNRDWEDISYGFIEGKNYIFVGDIGDNDKTYQTKYIYYFEEPLNLKDTIIINDVNRIEFKYPTSNYDSECLMFDPISKDLIVISKRETNEKVFSISYPYNNNDIVIAEYKTELKIGSSDNLLSWVTAGDISEDGKHILIKNYTNVYYWERGTDLYNTLNGSGQDIVNYKLASEPQGESICWEDNISGFYTVSEEVFGITPEIKYFKKKEIINGVDKKSLNDIKFDDVNFRFYDLIGNIYSYNEYLNSQNNMFIVLDLKNFKSIKLLRHKF